MNHAGFLSKKSGRALRWMLALQLTWLLLVLGLGVWWQQLLLSQAARIAALETNEAAENLARTQNMLFWESSTFLILVGAISAFLFLFYLREQVRARSIQAFFASVTHELRTPLTSIRLQAESIADSLEVEDGAKNPMISRLMEDTLRLETQVERLLELARVEGGGKAYVQSLDLAAWLERNLRVVRENSDSTRIEVLFAAPDTGILGGSAHAVLADPSALQVILRNLIENALRHGALAQRVSEQSSALSATSLASGSGTSSAPVRVSLALERSSDSQTEILRVRDFGKGAEGDVGKLGSLFTKGANSQGAGVGLYLVRALMERMKGRAEFRNHPEGGFEAVLSFRSAQAGEGR